MPVPWLSQTCSTISVRSIRRLMVSLAPVSVIRPNAHRTWSVRDSGHARHYPEKRGGNCLPCLIASYALDLICLCFVRISVEYLGEGDLLEVCCLLQSGILNRCSHMHLVTKVTCVWMLHVEAFNHSWFPVRLWFSCIRGWLILFPGSVLDPNHNAIHVEDNNDSGEVMTAAKAEVWD